MPRLQIDLPNWSHQDAATKQQWLQALQALFARYPDRIIFDAKSLKGENEQTPILFHPILAAKSAHYEGRKRYFVTTTRLGFGAYGDVYYSPIVIKEKADGSLEVCDRRELLPDGSNKYPYAYAVKMLYTKPADRFPDWTFAAQIDEAKSENAYVNHYLRRKKDTPPRQVVIDAEKETIYVLMPHVTGKALHHTFFTEPGVTVPFVRIYSVFYQLLAILINFHSERNVHRDIKVDNLVYDEATAKLQCVDYDAMTKEGSEISDKKGTKGYVAPEYIKRGVKAMHKTDVFSALAIFLYLLGAKQCILQKRNTDEALAIKSDREGPASIAHQFNLMAYDETGLFKQKYRLNKKIQSAFRELIEKMGEFTVVERCTAEEAQKKLEKILQEDFALSTLDALTRIVEKFPDTDRLIDLKFFQQYATTPLHNEVDKVQAFLIAVEKILAGLDATIARMEAGFTRRILFPKAEQVDTDLLKSLRNEVAWPTKEGHLIEFDWVSVEPDLDDLDGVDIEGPTQSMRSSSSFQ